MNNKKHQLGLTLIELLISLVIISIVVTLCANGFSFGSRVWAKVDTQQGNLDEIASAQRFIRKALNEAVYYVIDDSDTRNNYFNGEKNRMIFLAPSPQYGLDDYLYIYEIYKQKRGNSFNLSLKYLPASTYFSGAASTTNKNVELLRDVQNLTFQYYGINRKTGKLAWYDTWLEQDTLPLKISIAAELSNDKYEWPILIADTKFGTYILQ